LRRCKPGLRLHTGYREQESGFLLQRHAAFFSVERISGACGVSPLFAGMLWR
jgi:hypothetical protein